MPRAWVVLAVVVGGSSALATEPTRTKLLIHHLVPPVAQTTPDADHTYVLAVAPLQLGVFAGLAKDEKGAKYLAAVRVPQGGQNVFSAILPVADTPNLLEYNYSTIFDRRTVQLVPFAAFFVAVANTGDSPLTISPQSFALVTPEKRWPALQDSASIYGRFRMGVSALGKPKTGGPPLKSEVESMHRVQPYLSSTITIAPHGDWKGYVVFDVGVFTADEYNAFLEKAGKIKIELAAIAGKAPAVVQLSTKRDEVSAVCLPWSKTPRFEECEIVGGK